MSLAAEKETAINEFEAVLEEMQTREENSNREFAERLFNIMEKWLKKATIKYTNGLAAGSNPVTGTFNGELE